MKIYTYKHRCMSTCRGILHIYFSMYTRLQRHVHMHTHAHTNTYAHIQSDIQRRMPHTRTCKSTTAYACTCICVCICGSAKCVIICRICPPRLIGVPTKTNRGSRGLLLTQTSAALAYSPQQWADSGLQIWPATAFLGVASPSLPPPLVKPQRTLEW